MRWFWTDGDKSSTTDNKEQLSLLQRFTHPDALIPTAVLTTGILTASWLWRTRLRRIPNAKAIPESYLRARSIWGKVTSVGDADNFRLYHTPGGLLAGFALWRQIPKDRKQLMEQTIHVRVAGVDAPEAAHFGRPAQPYSQEALEQMKKLVDGKRVRVYLYRKDQYERVVGTAYVRPMGIPGLPRSWMRDVGLEMLRTGCATVYEAKMGAEFGGAAREAVYRQTEQRAKKQGRGMWGGMGTPGLLDKLKEMLGMKKEDPKFESPREYKTRMKKLEDGYDGLHTAARKR